MEQMELMGKEARLLLSCYLGAEISLWNHHCGDRVLPQTQRPFIVLGSHTFPLPLHPPPGCSV